MSTDSPKSTAMTYEIGNNNDSRKDNKSFIKFNDIINMKSIYHCQINLIKFTDENMKNKPQSNQLDNHRCPTEQMHPESTNNGCNT